MHFFHLFSFVVVASYAAALPQPAGQSEKYSNNVDTNLASGLEARSYQPALNSHKDSAALTSLKRRKDSEGLSEEPSRTDPSPPSTSSLKEIDDSAVIESKFSSNNLASTIDKVGDDVLIVFNDGELAGKRIDGAVGDKVARYLRKNAYVNAAIIFWVKNFVPGIRIYIKSGLSGDEYSKVEPDFTKKSKELEDEFNAGFDAIGNYTTNILNNVGSNVDNFRKIRASFGRTFSSRWTLLWELKALLGRFEAGKTLEGYVADIIQSFGNFRTDQQSFYTEIIKELGFKFSLVTIPIHLNPSQSIPT
ncbi:hypothetical protein BASA81_015032 [Batrachochytrium salamandrivorans]|nr:hypothetical protein BASA81_015032 [Batrachochytrium salamandrivorans]